MPTYPHKCGKRNGCTSETAADITRGHPAEPDAPELFTALQEQMGLRVEAQKAPVQVVVIDRLEAPSPN